MATKRPGGEIGGAPPAKKPSLAMAPLDIGPAAGEDDLDIKVLKVQNSKLAERLKERNRSREQLEARIEKMEQERDNYLRLQVSLKRHFTGLRERLLLVMVPLGCEDRIMPQEDLECVEGAGALDKISQSVYSCIEQFFRADRSQQSTGDEELRSRSLALLDQLTQSHSKRSESGELRDEVAVMETKCEQLQEELADLRFSLEQSQTRGDRLETRLEATLTQLRSRPLLQPQSSEDSSTQQSTPEEGPQEGGTALAAEGGGAGGGASATDGKLEDVEAVQGELQEAKELAQSRLEEMEKLSSQVIELRKQIDSMKLEQQQVPEAAVKESSVYKALQGQFSVAALEASQLRSFLEEAKALLGSARQQHFTQLEEIRGAEIKYQQEVREEMAALETALAAAKHDYSLLRMEFERTVASNEQAAPIAKELRMTVDSLQKTIAQHKSEVNRYKTRAHKAEQQLAKLQDEKEKESKEKVAALADKDATSDVNKEPAESASDKSEGAAELEEVKTELKAAQSELETLKQASSAEEREKADIIAAEKKAKGQVEELKKRFEDYRRDYEKRKEHIREEAARKTKSFSEDNRQLQKELSAKKHEAQALVSEMEYATQAFEEMQEQNIRLLQQLKEKDDANFKLMSERIKSNGVHKLLLEEKELLNSQLNAMAVERQRYSDLVSQLDERERAAEATIQGLDKELALQQQASESHRKRTEDSVKELAQLQLQVAEKQRLVQSIEQTLSNRTDECEKESQLHRRSMEEMGSLKRKLEKYKSREWMAAGDEVLLEEIKIYKAKLNCPCCSTCKKDTVLTKCFHVFCSECIRKRYDSRLRKCPKCGAAFGANDFHKIYLS